MVLTYPRRVLTLGYSLRSTIARYVVTTAEDYTFDQVLSLIPSKVECWGKLKQIKGDMIHAAELISCEKGRDMTYVQVRLQTQFP